MRASTALLLIGLSCGGFAQERIRDVIYLKQAGCAYTMDVFTPKTSNHKAVVFIVSGGWVSTHEGISEPAAAPLTARGFTVFEVVHGAQPKYTISEIVPMVRRAVRFIRANAATYHINPDSIGVTGASAGGHLSLEIAGLGDDGDPNAPDPVNRVSSRVNAVVAFMPPTDFRNWGALGKLPYDVPALKVFSPAFGVTDATTKEEKDRIANQLSPVLLVKAGYPPTLLVQGDADTLVPPQQSEEMDGVLDQNKVVHKLILIKGGGHDFATVFKGYGDAVDWFDKHLP